MRSPRKTLFSIFVLAVLGACNRPVMETVLNGFDQGKRTMKLEYRFFNDSLEGGSKGYRMETLFHFAIGNRATLKRERKAWLRKDFSLVKTEAVKQENTEITKTETWVEGNEIRIRDTPPTGEPTEKRVQHESPVLIELHPLVYMPDLKQPGQEKTYPLLFEDEARVVDLTVRYVGPETIYEDNQAIPSLHYQVQVITSPDEFDDYFVDPKSGNILKIQFGLIKFLPVK